MAKTLCNTIQIMANSLSIQFGIYLLSVSNQFCNYIDIVTAMESGLSAEQSQVKYALLSLFDAFQGLFHNGEYEDVLMLLTKIRT